MNSIPASFLVRANPSVLSAGGNPLSLNAVFLTASTRIPIGTVGAFPSTQSVADFFGPDSIEATLAAIYFAGYEGALTLPSTLYFAQYNAGAVGAYLRSGSFAGFTLAQIQALSGTLIVSVDGRTVTSANINLAGATSFTNAAALVQAGLQTPGGVFVGVGTIDDGAGGAGNTLTITGVTSGVLKVGDIVVGGPTPAAITAFLTGTGGVGTYTVGGAAQDYNPGGAITVASTATATYDAQLAEFLVHSPTTGVGSTIAFATGTLSGGLRLTSLTGAVLSEGAAAATPNSAMNAIAAVTQNWATFATVFEPDLATKLAFAAWVQTTRKRFAYVAWDSDAAPLAGAAPASFAAVVQAAAMNGIYPRYEPATDAGNGRKAAFICGTVASTDYEAGAGSLAFAYKGQAGLVADITDETVANNLIANSYNFYGAYATANDRFVNEQKGTTPGPYKFFNQYVDQIWLNNALQLALMVLMTSIRKLPYNTTGYNNIRSAMLDPVQSALFNGVIQPGITLSNSQRAQVNTDAGVPIANTLETSGYYIQILDADPVTRANGGSPPIKFWYTSGGAIQNIDLASINVQ
jgi:hypothetical protein